MIENNREMRQYQTKHVTIRYKTGLIMRFRRFFILALSLTVTLLITSLGLIESPDSALSTIILGVFGLITVLLIFGVEIDEIHISRDGLHIQFSEDDATDED